MPRPPRTSPRKKPRQQRSQATVDCILDATARVLCTTGYDRASTNRIALAAGVSVGSLYQYFPSKEALVAGLVERHTGQMTSLVKGKLAEVASAPVDVAVRTMIDAMFAAHAVDPKLHKVLIEQVPRIGKLEEVVGVEREVESLVEVFLEARRGDIRRTRIPAVAFVLCRVVEAVTHAAVLAELGEPRRSEVAEELTDMLLGYLPARGD
ncbi:MAG TPA: TetR/AcrR family transcriptional regulator [Polyangiaceae bacterium]|jgi:AcrR family transcriptional regulator